MSRLHGRLRALAFLFLLFPLWWLQRAHADPMAAERGAETGSPAKSVQPGGDDGARHAEGQDDGDDDCTRTLGYWKNHSAHADHPNQHIPWPISEDTLLCGETWFDILHAPPRGEAWIILAHQWIPAMLNEASGANTDVLGNALDEAGDLLADHCSGLGGEDRHRALELADLFDDYNNGRIGPPHCGDEGEDCNGNGIDDSIDISGGTSADRNHNGIPDECEFFIKTFCNGTGVDDGGVACPCGNEVPPGGPSGCANSTGSGATLTANGNALVGNDTLVLTATNVPIGKVSYFLHGSEAAPVAFGDGSRCIGSFVRLQKVASSTGSDTFPPPNSLPISQQLGIDAGDTSVFQVVYRDGNGPCHRGANATNAVLVVWGP